MSKIRFFFQAEQHEGETVTTDSSQHEDESVTTNSLMNPLASRVHRDSQQEMPDIIRQKNVLTRQTHSQEPVITTTNSGLKQHVVIGKTQLEESAVISRPRQKSTDGNTLEQPSASRTDRRELDFAQLDRYF